MSQLHETGALSHRGQNHPENADTAVVTLKGERRRTINPVFGLVARWFFMGEVHPVEATLNLVKEGDRWKVCGQPFRLVES